ncbi:MAG: hypothetical protein MZV70_10735 [Desulfobacterales bacterium]|nr:hypothetical protein [Desulfobacterales bacterium]
MIGYPVLIKAAAGGGGKGMRVVGTQSGDLRDACISASREARSAFGNGDIYLEKYLEQAPARGIPGIGGYPWECDPPA